jgi:hypothetical protein
LDALFHGYNIRRRTVKDSPGVDGVDLDIDDSEVLDKYLDDYDDDYRDDYYNVDAFQELVMDIDEADPVGKFMNM